MHEETLRLPRWPSELAGMRVAVLSDLHTGSWLNGVDRLSDIVSKVNALHPDCVVLLGDYVRNPQGKVQVPPDTIAEQLKALHAPLSVYSVLGNHDWWYDGGEGNVRRALEQVGVHVLEDDAVPLTYHGARVWLVGLQDSITRHPSMTRALSPVPVGEPVLLLTHEPDLFPAVPASVSLTLAGHTHGGQVRIPLFGPPVVPSKYGRRYAAGVIVEDGRTMFVTTGVGTSILPVRLGVPPEIAILTLTR